MNDQLKIQLTEILKQISTSVKDVSDFSISQLLDIARQYIAFGIWSNLIAILILFAGCTFFTNVFIVGLKDEKNNGHSDEVELSQGVGFYLTIAMGIFLYHKVENLIMLLSAPKVWLILQIKSLIS